MGDSCWPRDELLRLQIRALSRETRWIGARYTPTETDSFRARQTQAAANRAGQAVGKDGRERAAALRPQSIA